MHRAAWPSVEETATTAAAGGAAPDAGLLGAVGEALAGIRKAKSEAKVGMRAEVSSIVLAGPTEWVGSVRAAEADLRAAGRVTGSLDYAETETPEVRDAVLIPVEKPKA